ncbi:sensor histidine kinase [Paenibacillus elgii]|uniref:sensor histidine kinase n=1 Tax=Paenibacillus elgii TaxID=189691 RepID=UPI00203B6066|nr:HAMP domain-containing sensor histidine kinase [Paenibacillus elgii]MCM3270082.1 HAMP domain-containing histidine kinase [Paenibacillus elgii]
MKLRRSLRRQVVMRFLGIVLLTLLLMEGVFFFAVRQFYYNGIANVLTNHAVVSANFYANFAGDLFYNNLSQHLNRMVQYFAYETAELEIVDRNGTVLAASSGFAIQESIRTGDVKEAWEGRTGVWTGNQAVTNERVMAVSNPLVYQGQTLAVIRYVTSLTEVDRVLRTIYAVSAGVGGVVLLLVLLVSLPFANSIVRPIKRMTAASAEMAKGRFDVRVNESYDNEIGELAGTLNYMAREIVRSEALKNDFISSISHEIRTPLSSIKGWSETILTGGMDDKEETRLGLGIIAKETDRLIGLVEELLDFSRLHQKSITLDLARVPMNELLGEAVLQMRSKAEQKRIDLRLSVPSESVTVIGDTNRLKQVCLNLIDNAIKFTGPDGRIDISLEREDRDAIVRIADNGIGISREHLGNVQTKFYQADPKAEGTGIGLAICREIVDLHQGSIRLDSAEGEGTTVTIRLPLEEAEAQGAEASGTSFDKPESNGG